MAYVRFASFHRVGHTFLLVSFLGLALTGLPLKYSQHEWAKAVALALGGFGSTERLAPLLRRGHLRLLRDLRRAGWCSLYSARPPQGHAAATTLLFGPDSPVPNLRDVKDFFRMLRWFVGLGPKPTFERWTYWEKFDFWGALADIVIIGSTGLILWFPNFFCQLPAGHDR